MTERTPFERLDDALDAMWAHPEAPLTHADADIAELLAIAGELRDLPRPDFKARLRTSLTGAAPATRPATSYVPAGQFHVSACLVIRDAREAIEFYKEAFGATEVGRMADDEGRVMHAEIRIGDSPIQIAGEAPHWHNLSPQALRGSPVSMQLYVEDVDAAFARAVAAGATVLSPVQNYFYGDRAGRLLDPFGHRWLIGTHVEDVSPEEMQRRMNAMFEGS